MVVDTDNFRNNPVVFFPMTKFTTLLFICVFGLSCRPSHDYPARIGIVRLGMLDATYFAQAKKEIEAFYNAEVVDLGTRDLPTLAYYQPRNRYRADKLIDWLRETRPDSVDYIMALTASDISHTKGNIEDYGILGLAFCPGRSGVISMLRLSKGAKNQTHTMERFSKTVLHELGHNFGLPHCTHAKHCLMRDACGTVKTLDKEEKTVCGECRQMLGKLLR
jgi:archaemetzincin